MPRRARAAGSSRFTSAERQPMRAKSSSVAAPDDASSSRRDATRSETVGDEGSIGLGLDIHGPHRLMGKP